MHDRCGKENLEAQEVQLHAEGKTISKRDTRGIILCYICSGWCAAHWTRAHRPLGGVVLNKRLQGAG